MSTSEGVVESKLMAEPGPAHHWLQKLVGEWTYDYEAEMEPGKPPVKFHGTETVRSLEGRWVEAEGHGEFPGGSTHTTVMTLGYNPEKGRYVGTWIGSMMDWLWVYDGQLDPAQRVLTLESDGPSMTVPGELGRYRDVIEFESDDRRYLKAYFQQADGTWQPMMTGTFERKR
jgi:hypothetical protein